MLKICEMYPAIEGESSYVGLPCVIVRLAGCNLDCSYCDTKYAQTESHETSIDEALDFCRECGLKLVLLTGGEPLMQGDSRGLMRRLVGDGFKVLLETNGSLPLVGAPEEVVAIVDVKCPGSGMEKQMEWENLNRLRPHDEVKFVISDRGDFDYAMDVMTRYSLLEKAAALFSPVFGRIDPATLAEWILETRLPIRLNLQIHKFIWEPDSRGR